jgi:prepilin-type N-terminal cleavage/methylation domain-containing protein
MPVFKGLARFSNRLNTRTGVLASAKQLGFTLIEMMVVVAISASVYATWQYKTSIDARTNKGEAIATTVKPYYEALHSYVRKYRLALQNATPITSILNPLQPTVLELQALNVMGITYPSSLSIVGGSPSFVVSRLPLGCVGATCDIGYLFATSVPLLSGSKVAEGVLSAAIAKIGGLAGYTNFTAPGVFTGLGGWTANNPSGAVAGILGVYQTYSASGDATLLSVGDTRDPLFAGGMTLNGTVTGTTSTLVVNGNTNITGTLAVGAGGVVTGGGVSAGSFTTSGTVSAAGALKGDSVQVTGSAVAGNSCTEPGAIKRALNNAPPAIQYGAVMCVPDGFGGNLRWTVLVTGVGLGNACTNGDAGKMFGIFDAICVGGKYVSVGSLFASATLNASCSSPGLLAYDTQLAFPRAVLCRYIAGAATMKYYLASEVTSDMNALGSQQVTPDQNINPAPVCRASGGNYPATPLFEFGSAASGDGGFGFWTDSDGAGGWNVRMRNGAGANLTGNPNASAKIIWYCYN